MYGLPLVSCCNRRKGATILSLSLACRSFESDQFEYHAHIAQATERPGESRTDPPMPAQWYSFGGAIYTFRPMAQLGMHVSTAEEHQHMPFRFNK